MKTNIVRIGNSRGIRIPKALLDQCQFSETVELEVQGSQLVIRATDQPRQGWAEAFEAMAERGDDALLDGDALTPSEWDQHEWDW